MNRNLDDDFAQVARVASRREDPRVYTPLNGCRINPRVLYNVWAVVTKVRMEPSQTKKNADRIMAMVYIQDPTFKGSFGFPDYQFSIMGTRREDFPPLSVSAVIRIHDMETQAFLGESTGRVWNPAKVTVIKGGVGDPIKPHNADQWDDSFRFTECDVAKVKKLRGWWASFPQAGPPPPPLPATGSQFPTETEVSKAIAEIPDAEAEAHPGPSTHPEQKRSRNENLNEEDAKKRFVEEMKTQKEVVQIFAHIQFRQVSTTLLLITNNTICPFPRAFLPQCQAVKYSTGLG